MKRHFYNSRLAKVPWFIRRFGFREMLIKPFRWIFARRIVENLPPTSFSFEGERLAYFYHTYNTTWVNERAVEVPIALHYIAKANPVETLEIGNVLSHYYPVEHQVLDKYEVGPGVINCDILDFQPATKYSLIISISTFEHIGFDDEGTTESRLKIAAAVEQCRKLLADNGRLVLTLPIGYNPELDQMLKTDELGPVRQLYLRRTGIRQWVESTKDEALKCRFKRPFPYANAITILEFSPLS